MERFVMKIGILTSSRADFGIYLPLLQKMKSDSFFEIEIIAFGTHLSKFHGYTILEIEKENFTKIHKISALVSNDDAQSIVTSYGITVLKFADFWSQNSFDLVFCLGDRFEMSAAVQASIPFNVKIAHIHGGETTLGAIDNIYRHQITLASQLHFTSTTIYRNKIASLTGSEANIFEVGSLSLDQIQNFVPINKDEFQTNFNISNRDFALVTFHPETVEVAANEKYADEMKKALQEISGFLNIVITMPNADTLGSVFRKKIEGLKTENPEKVVLIENFGKLNYFSAMHYSKILIGNTSSGILEAASFKKYVINVGNRQKGRAQSSNVLDIDFCAKNIVSQTKKALNLGVFEGENIYFQEQAAMAVINIIKKL